MLAFIGEDNLTFNEFFRCLQSVCKRDPMRDYAPDEVSDHSDGWGFIDCDHDFISFSKFSDPIYKSNVPELKGKYRLLHARNASEGQPVGFLKSHPYHGTSTNYDHFLMHNGVLDKSKISHGLSTESLENMTDSEVFLDLICTSGGKEAVTMFIGALNEVYSKNALVSGLNLFFLSVSKKNGDSDLILYSDALSFHEYHRFFYSKGKDWQCIYSSSLIYSRYFPGKLDRIPLESRTVYRIGPEGIAELFRFDSKDLPGKR